MTDQGFVNGIIAAIKANSHARSFYFPDNQAKRKSQNLRLGREIGYGLKNTGIISSLYSRIIVTFSFDRTGVQIDNKEFVMAIHEGMQRAREYISPLVQ